MTEQLEIRALKVPCEPVFIEACQRAGIELLLRRDDLIDKAQSGNKFYKLHYNLMAARTAGAKTVVSFGGAYSNHLYSLAAAGAEMGFGTLGIIRGEKPKTPGATLIDLERLGMTLKFVDRAQYRALTTGQEKPVWRADYYVIPEGGDNALGRQGAAAITHAVTRQLDGNFNALCVAVGTGTTLAGIASALQGRQRALGFSVLKNTHSGISACARSLADVERWRLLWGFDDGGYGKPPGIQAQKFWADFERDNQIEIEPVYTLKMLRGIARLADAGYWPRGTRLVAVHTGGLQGRRSYQHLLQHITERRQDNA